MAFFKKETELCCLCYWFENFFFFFNTMANCLFVELEQSCHKPGAYTSALCALHTGVARVCVHANSWIPTN